MDPFFGYSIAALTIHPTPSLVLLVSLTASAFFRAPTKLSIESLSFVQAFDFRLQNKQKRILMNLIFTQLDA